MKKFNLLLAALFVVGFAMAQTATITQTGNDHKADVTQMNGTNTATIIQNGGDGNRLGAPIIGDVGVDAGTDVSLAKGLVQDGDDNKADITQTGNLNIIQQFRPLRDIYNSVYQKGNSNTLKIDQIGDNNVIGQAPHEYNSLEQNNGNGNNATILQHGNSNKLTYFYQLNDGNTADIQQIGSLNKIESATQKKLANVSPTNNKLNILQEGTSNTASLNEEGDNITGDIYQSGTSNTAKMQLSRSRAWGDIDQIGDDNKAYIFVNKSYIGDDNRGVVYQFGNSNYAREDIGQRDGSLASSNNTMDISQKGDFNHASILAEGNNHKAYVDQVGNSNKLVIEQAKGNDNIARLKQDGGADANILQNGSTNTLKGIGAEIWASSLNGSILDLDQIGTGNTLSLQQTNGASAIVYQDGLTNTAVVIQN